ncbi:MAG: glycosyltransferase family 4 protein [Terriglobia bacterium]
MISVLAIHNYYRGANPSGENTVFESETQLLRSRGHTVYDYVRRSDEIAGLSLQERISLIAQVAWSKRSYQEIKKQLTVCDADVAHFHNVFPLVSVSALRACQEAGVPVVQTLHNYRPICLNGLLFRNGSSCEACLGYRFPWPGVIHRCYRNSSAYSAVAGMTQFLQNLWCSWSKDPDVFIAPSEHIRQKYITAGFDSQRIVVKPNFVVDDGRPAIGQRDYALFVGRLSAEKGLNTLLKAWRRLPDIPLLVVGGGPDEKEARRIAHGLNNVKFVGRVDRETARGYMASARFAVVPSECYENFPMVVIEAFASGTPVIASALGALPELIADGYNGLLFKPKDAEDLARRVAWMWAHPREAAAFGSVARSTYVERFTPERNYNQLLGVYGLAMRIRAAKPPVHSEVGGRFYSPVG